LGCRDDVGLRIALLDAAGGVARVESVADSGDFLGAANRKAFTVGASWFVYATMDGTLRVVDLSAQEWVSALAPGDVGGDVGAEVDLAPLQLGSQLLVHSGKLLRWADLATGQAATLGDDLPSPHSCGADFTIAGPHQWCGGPWLPRLFALPRDQSGVVFPDRQGKLFSVDMAAGTPAAAAAVSDSVVTCRVGCEGVLEFVP
jgi:hypothetical protein